VPIRCCGSRTPRGDLPRHQKSSAAHAIDITERPAFALRMLNHWDNLDGSVEARLRRQEHLEMGAGQRWQAVA
jgi:hypothetical protein